MIAVIADIACDLKCWTTFLVWISPLRY